MTPVSHAWRRRVCTIGHSIDNAQRPKTLKWLSRNPTETDKPWANIFQVRRVRGMPTESELVDAICEWLRREYGADVLMLIHEEVRGRGGRRPDLLAMVSSFESNSVDDVTMILVEIENSSHGATRATASDS